MGDFSDRVQSYIGSSENLSRRHVHPRLLKMFELGGIQAAFVRAEGAALWDADGARYLDMLSGGGVYMLGRNHPKVHDAIADVLAMQLPNLTVMNASVLGGMVAQKLLALAGEHFTKVVFANSGSESTEVALRFARQVTRRRRFLYVEGAFHGRSYGAISVCGFSEMRTNIDPALPTCTPVPPNDIKALKRELRAGDVAGFIFEPVQGMTGLALDEAYLREAENLCEQYGTILIADEVQTGLCRTGPWFSTTSMGVRPHVMTVSKALSGGAVPVAAVLVNEQIYDRIYSGFGSGFVYFSTFAENNLAMAAALSTLETLEEMDAPTLAAEKGKRIEVGLAAIAERFDCIDRIEGRGLMRTVYFRDSQNKALAAQQKLMGAADPGAFAAAFHVHLFKEKRILAQIPGPGLNAIKILPPVICTDEEIDAFLRAFEETLAFFYDVEGPVVSLGKAFAKTAGKKLAEQVQAVVPDVAARLGASEKKNA